MMIAYLLTGTSLLWLVKSCFFKKAAGFEVRDSQKASLIYD